MPQITVGPQGEFLAYEDSGAPPGVTVYTTLVVIHGSGFNGAIFSRLIPFAAQNNLRLVAVNRRDNPGSTPLSDVDLEMMHGSDRGAHMQWLKDRGVEILKFVETYIDENKIPTMTEDGKQGGLALLAWSTGALYVISALAHASDLSKGIQDKMEGYIRLVIFQDAPGFAFGVKQEGLVVIPRTLGPKEKEEFLAGFGGWVSGYFNHTLGAERKIENVAKDPDSSPPPSTARMSKEELSATASVDATFRSEGMWHSISPEEFDENFVKGILDVNVWPRVRVVSLWCEHTLWISVHGNWELERRLEERAKTGVETRPITVEMIAGPNTNHFIHWEDPEAFMKVLSTHL